jgi:hypothetical protein
MGYYFDQNTQNGQNPHLKYVLQCGHTTDMHLKHFKKYVIMKYTHRETLVSTLWECTLNACRKKCFTDYSVIFGQSVNSAC